MGYLFELLLESLVGATLHATGELALWAFTFGRHRIRWWNTIDAGTDAFYWTWSHLVGLLVWAGALIAVYFVFLAPGG